MSNSQIALIDHPALGPLEPHDKLPGTLRGSLELNSHNIEFWVAPDGGPLEAALALASEAASKLADIDSRCRELIAANSLNAYNEDWRFGSILADDGRTEEFEKPLLTVVEFCSKLEPTTVEVTGEKLLAIWYADGDMFWGHSFCVTSFDGMAFGDVHVELLG